MIEHWADVWEPWLVSIMVVAHRGSNKDEPEHSLAAYLLAVEEGVDGVECDVRLTADGTLVCVHDRRVSRTSNGRGVVSSLTLAELERHDFSGGPSVWRDFEDPWPDETRSRILTLRTMVATLLDASSTISFSIETKHPTRYGAYVEESLVELLEYFGLLRPAKDGSSRVRLMSFSSLALRRMHKMAPGTPTVLLMGNLHLWRKSGWLPREVDVAGISITALRKNPGYVALSHAKGHQVHVWTVDQPADVALCVETGVDAIISNSPAMVREILGTA
ncbi:MAG: glycerophosphodiester phosphodiesterase [Actinobacteria bacterium]|nr:MAG: glycerophosphodiester phosphodiesterase [Actinomycetota bacterium]